MKLHHGYLTISDFAAYCGTTRQTLQYYDRIGLLEPIQVGKQGYRYYHPLQGHEFRMIHSLQRSGCSLNEVEEILNSSDYEMLQQRIAEKRESLNAEILRIQREQVYLRRLMWLLTWFRQYPLETPFLFQLDSPLSLYELPFPTPCEPYSVHYYDTVLHFADHYRANSDVQAYPYFLYVNPEELQGSLRFCKLLCLRDEQECRNGWSFIAPTGEYLCMRTYPDKDESVRQSCYKAMHRYMKAHGLEPNGGSLEMPFCIPQGLREDGHRFFVVFFIPAVRKEGTEGEEA